MGNNSFSPKLALMRGAAWSLGTRWGIRIIGFANTVIMARLVMPADYGLVAMAFLVVGMLQALLDFSVATALLRKDVVTPDEINSAWSLRGVQGILMACLMVAFIPIAQIYFRDDRVALILVVFAGCVAVSGFSNIGMTLAQKDLDFALEFRFQLYSKIASVAVTIAAGFWFRDYRALMLGIASGYLGGVLLSYLMHPYRPNWNRREWTSIWQVTKWLMVANVGGFMLRKGDEVIAARIGGPEGYGYYNVGADLGQMPAGEVGPAVLKSFLPVLAGMGDRSTDEVNAAVIKTSAVIAAITLPMGLGFAAVAEPATAVILGASWAGAVPYVAAFSVIGALQVLAGPINSLLTLRGHTVCQSQAVWIEFFCVLLCAIILVPTLGLMGLVMARGVGVVVNIGITIAWGRWRGGLSVLPLLFGYLRALFGALLMHQAVLFLLSFYVNDVVRLFAGIVFGVAIYLIWCWSTWLLIGRPVNGLEAIAIELLNKKILRKDVA